MADGAPSRAHPAATGIRASEPPISLLGFDALLELPPPARFAGLLAERGAPIKALLLDQAFAAGVGNWIADEVLYQARIAPGAPRALAVPAGRRSAARSPSSVSWGRR